MVIFVYMKMETKKIVEELMEGVYIPFVGVRELEILLMKLKRAGMEDTDDFFVMLIGFGVDCYKVDDSHVMFNIQMLSDSQLRQVNAFNRNSRVQRILRDFRVLSTKLSKN